MCTDTDVYEQIFHEYGQNCCPRISLIYNVVCISDDILFLYISLVSVEKLYLCIAYLSGHTLFRLDILIKSRAKRSLNSRKRQKE